GGARAIGLADLDRPPPDLAPGPRRVQLVIDVGEPVLAGEAPGRASRCIGGDREAVPAPQVAVTRYQPLAGFEQLVQPSGIGTVDDADLGESARKLFRRVDMAAERIDILRQGRIAGIEIGAGPVERCRAFARSLEVVAGGGATGRPPALF